MESTSGHQSVLKRLIQKSKEINGTSGVLTFANHPSTILNPEKSVTALCSNEQKLKLLESFGIDFVLMLPFTKELSQLTAERFLQKVVTSFPLHAIVLGHDAVIGKERHGTKEKVLELSKKMGFQVEYIPPKLIEEVPASSSMIRKLVQKGDLNEAKMLLGRPYSISGTITAGKGIGKTLGYATANLEVVNLCLPHLEFMPLN